MGVRRSRWLSVSSRDGRFAGASVEWRNLSVSQLGESHGSGEGHARARGDPFDPIFNGTTYTNRTSIKQRPTVFFHPVRELGPADARA